MSLLNETNLRERAQKFLRARTFTRADSVITEELQKREQLGTHDIFLSHSYEDRELVLGVALVIEDLGFTVYLDWRNDAQLDRGRVTRETAARLRERMKRSRSLFYSTTEQAGTSKWMPWELGYKDGQSARVAILPVTSGSTDSNVYKGQEYLGIYPYVTRDRNRKGEQCLWIHASETEYVVFDKWLEGEEPYDHS